MPDNAASIHIFGIRHHGPGSARSLRAALQALQPDAVLVEGPPEGTALLPLLTSSAMRPPVALLLYDPGDPACAVYYPFAEFSPEWQAARYALAQAIPVRLMDLAQSHQLAMLPRAPAPEPSAAEELPATEPSPGETGQPGSALPAELDPAVEESAAQPAEHNPLVNLPADPLRALAEAAGYSEHEQWWDHLVEQRRDPVDVFAAILEAMSAVREALPPETDPITARREAAMRQAIRSARDEGYRRIAVVCGAWHAPALVDLAQEKEDAALLRGLPKVNLQATWVPWTYPRLARGTGYGAGIQSPGWYHHLWNTERDLTTRWLISVARLLRAEDLDITPAHVIEAVRLAEALAALRERPLPGLPELNEAVLTVFCFGNPVPLRLIEERLIIGDAIGSVPPETPMAPLQGNFERETRRLRLLPEASERVLDLDLRKPTDLDRSHLLHRLNLLGIAWGQNRAASLQAGAHGRGGTFHEVWDLKWQPEYVIQLIEAGQWGNTIAAAAAARVCHAADRAPDLSGLTGLVEDVLLAELPAAVAHVMRCLQAQAAVTSDTNHLMRALPPLAGVLRYGNVRQTDTAMIAQVVDGLVARICIGLAGACASLNDEAAAAMFEQVEKVDEAITRMPEERYRLDWQQALAAIADQGGVHGLVAGRAARLLMDRGVFSHEEAARRLGLVLSTASDPLQAAAWIEGFLRGSGQFLVHDEQLLALIDAWLSSLADGAFQQLLPLLRRTFATFARPERRAIGERLRSANAGQPALAAEASLDFDPQRADAVLPLVRQLLGIPENKGANA